MSADLHSLAAGTEALRRVRGRRSSARSASRCCICWCWASASARYFNAPDNGSYLQFVAPGVIGMTVLFTSIFSGIGMLWDRQFGFLKETLVAPVPRIES